MSKRRFLVALLLIAAVLLAACGDSGGRGDNQGQGNAAGNQGGGQPGQQDAGQGQGSGPGNQGQGQGQGGDQPATGEGPVAIEVRGNSPEALQRAWEDIRALGPNTPFTLNVSEQQLEAQLTAAVTASGQEVGVSDLDITLDNNQIAASFTLGLTQPTNVSVPASAVFEASIDANGDLQLIVVEAQAGQVPVPEAVLTVLSEALVEAMTGAQSSAEADVTLTAVAVDDGVMTLTGYRNP
jgi:hypothetical protein